MAALERLGAGVLRVVLRAAGLPTMGTVEPASAGVADRYAAAADRLLGAGGGRVERDDLPMPLMPFLCWMAEHRPVLFHGSARDDIDELAPVRASTDASEFGNQRAVFATDDPVWAAWFAVVSRDQALRGMRNGSIGLARPGAAAVYPRWYFFSVDRTDGVPAFRPGTLYVLPSDGFTRERRELGIIDTGQLVNPAAVRPAARVAIDPADVPFVDRTVTHTRAKSELRTMLEFGRAHRRSR